MMLQRQTDSNLMYLRLLHHTQEESDSLLMVVPLISLDNMLTDLHFDWGASQFVSKEVQVGVVGYVPITQAEIGDATGLSTVHVNRSIQKLRSDKLVSLEKGGCTIWDWDGLKRAATFDPTYLHFVKAE
jgi:CRP-like cAMP-binding protein